MQSCFFVFGPDRGKQQAQLKKIQAEVLKQAGAEPELLNRYADQDSLAEMLDSLGTGSLFYGHLVMQVFKAEAFNAADAKLIQKYWSKPNPHATLVVISEDYKAKDRFKFARKEELVIFYEADEREKHGWIQSYINRMKGAIEPAALELLVDIVDPDTLEMQKTCDLLLSLHADRRITTADVEDHVFHSREENVFTLFEAVLKLDLEQALEVLQTMLQAQEAEPVQIVTGLQWQLRNLMVLKSQSGSGPASRDTFMQLNIKRPSSQRMYNEALRRWKESDIERRIRILADHDVSMRQARAGSHGVMLDLMLYQMIANPDARLLPVTHPALFDTDWLA